MSTKHEAMVVMIHPPTVDEEGNIVHGYTAVRRLEFDSAIAMQEWIITAPATKSGFLNAEG